MVEYHEKFGPGKKINSLISPDDVGPDLPGLTVIAQVVSCSKKNEFKFHSLNFIRIIFFLRK